MPELHVAENGAVVADDRSREWLASRAGRYRLVSSAPGLLLGVSVAGAQLPGRVVLVGDLARVAFPDVISMLAQTRSTGVLRLHTGGTTRALVFANGELRGASSMRAGERLGEVAVRMGLVKREDMEGLISDAEPGQKPGRLAVEHGMLEEHELWNVMQEQVTTIFQGIMRDAEGTFTLTDEAVADVATVPGLAAEMLLMESLRRADEEQRDRSQGSRERLEVVLTRFNEAFRDIFATACAAGAGPALAHAAITAFAAESGQAACFRDVGFTAEGDFPVDPFLDRFLENAAASDAEAEHALLGVMSKAMLFLLFVAGEHLDPTVHEALHARAKAVAAGAAS